MSDLSHDFESELPAYVAGKLEPPAVRRVESWLDAHPERAEFVSDWKRIARGLQEGGSDLDLACPSPTRIVGWARGDHTDPTGALRRHVESCASCGIEADVARRNRPRRSLPLRPPKQIAIYRFVSLAAVAGLALGVGFGMLFDRWESSSPGAPRGGPVPLLQLDPSLRSDGTPVVYRRAPGQEWVPVATLPPLPPNAAPESVFQFGILEAGGGEVWSQELTAAAIESHLAVSGVLLLLVPAEVLEPGSYTLRLTAGGDPASPPVLRVPFQVE
jgi:hypothetical protein